MNSRFLLCMSLLLLPSLAGCSDQSIIQSEPPELSREGNWTDCLGVYTTFLWPRTTGPGAHFEGWEPDSTQWANEVRMVAMECRRFSWGKFERGPIKFVLEYHNNMNAPESCEKGSYSQPWILNAVLTDNPEIASLLQESEGLPMQVSQISLAAKDLGIAFLGTATWDTPETSTLEVHQELSPNEPALFGLPPRFYWQNPSGGVSWVEFDVAVQGPTYPSERLVTGTMQPPMLMANLSEQYVGQGFAFDAGDFGGTIERFRDLQCESPY